MTRVCFDYDPLLYAAASIGEEKSIKVVHKASGREVEFSNRSAFWGHWKTKSGGWLAEANKGRETPWVADDFTIIDQQTPEPIEFCLRTLKTTIESVKEKTGAKVYYGFSGRGKVFREDVSTIVKYKGNRDNVLKPIHLEGLKNYLVKYHNCEIVEMIEADDMCTIHSVAAWKKWEKSQSDNDKLILCAVDKDYYQSAAHILHPFDLGDLNSHDGSFGFLKLDESGKEKKVVGRGRLWLYFQVMNGDDADNYFANSASPMKWAMMSAYKALKNVKNDKEAFEALVKGYKTLYPQPKRIVGWRGYEDQFERTKLLPNSADFEIDIDWLYVLQENFTLALMLRKLDDKVDVKEVMTKLGVEF